MNIFVVDSDPKTSAQQLCDKHVVKMILESAQMLCSPFPKGDAPYKRAYYNHPCTLWARESQRNYEWLVDHAYAMCQEYTRRYGKVHKSLAVIEWCGKNCHKLNTAYRSYYNGEKAYFAKWTKREAPNWFQIEQENAK